MKREFVLISLLVFAGAGMRGQTDVSSEYIDNASFDDKVTFGANLSGDMQTSSDANCTDYANYGWSLVTSESWTAAGTFSYDSGVTLNGCELPASGPSGSSSTAGLGISVGWSGAVVYQQDIELPEGNYKLSLWGYNTNSSATQATSEFELLDEEGNEVWASSKSSYTYGKWEEETLGDGGFYYMPAGSYTLQLGLDAVSGGSGSNAKVMFDDVTLLSVESASTDIPVCYNLMGTNLEFNTLDDWDTGTTSKRTGDGWTYYDVETATDGYNAIEFYEGYSSHTSAMGYVKQYVWLPAGDYTVTGYGWYRYGASGGGNSYGWLYVSEDDMPIVIDTTAADAGGVRLTTDYGDDYESGLFPDDDYEVTKRLVLSDSATVCIGYYCAFPEQDNSRSWCVVGPIYILRTGDYNADGILGAASISVESGSTVFAHVVDTISVTYPDIYGMSEAGLLSGDVIVSDGTTETTATVESIDGGYNIITGITTAGVYTITIPAGLYGSSAVSSEAEELTVTVIADNAMAESFTGYLATTIDGETFYLSRGGDEGVQAVTDGYGLSVTVSAAEDNISSVGYQDNEAWLYSDGSTVYGDGDASTAWVVLATEGGYTLLAYDDETAGGYLMVSDGIVALTGSADSASVWVLTEATVRDAAIAAAETAQAESAFAAAGYDYAQAESYRLDTVATAVTDISEQWNSTEAEVMTESFSVSAGLYKISLYAFERIGGGSNNATRAGDLYFAGYDDVTAYMYVDGNEVQLANIFDSEQSALTDGDAYEHDDTTYYVPNDLTTAEEYFDAGYYENTVYIYKSEDDTLTVGMRYASYASNRWVAYQLLTVARVWTDDAAITDAKAEVEAMLDSCKAILDNSVETTEGAADALEAVISEVEGSYDSAATTDALEEMVSTLESALEAYELNAYPENGYEFDYTAFIENNSFETGDLTGWTTESGSDTGVMSTSNSTYAAEGSDGDYLFNTWSWYSIEYYIEQTIDSLPAGNYTVRALASSTEGNSITLSAGGSSVTVTATGKDTFDEVELNNVVCYGTEEEGITILMESDTWFKADNFRLYMTGNTDDGERGSAYDKLQAVCDEASELVTNKVNVGEHGMQIPVAAWESLSASLEAVAVLTNAETVETLTAAREALDSALQVYYSVELNEPSDEERYTISVNDAEFVGYNGLALTYYENSSTQGGYSMSWLEEPNVNYAQSLSFATVPDSMNTYYISFEDVDGGVHYLCSGAQVGGNARQIRTSTEADSALAVKVTVSYEEDGVFWLYNTEAEAYIGGQDEGVYTTNEYSLKIAVTSPAEVNVSAVDGSWLTLMVPFNAEVPDGVEAYELESISDDGAYAYLSAVESLEANTPYVICSESEVVLSDYGHAIDDSYSDGLLTGVYDTTEVDDGYYVLEGDAFRVVESEGATVNPYGAYMEDDCGAADVCALVLPGGDSVPVGIDGATLSDDDALVDVYTLGGVRVKSGVRLSEALSGLRRGIYIVDGVKRVVK